MLFDAPTMHHIAAHNFALQRANAHARVHASANTHELARADDPAIARGHDVPRTRARGKLEPTWIAASRRARNIAIVRELHAADDVGGNIDALLAGGAPFASGPIALDVVEAFFEEPLPIGTVYAIPSGTGASHSAEDSHMSDLDKTAIDAIDAGCTDVGRLSPQVAYFMRNSRAKSTRTLYRWAWDRVLKTCERLDRCPMPMDEGTATMVIVDSVNDGLALGTLRILASVMSVAHSIGRHPDPTETEAFRSVMRGIGRVLSHKQDQKAALALEDLLLIRDSCDADENHVRGVRDWAIVSFGFAGAFRRSEIVARNHADLEFVDDGLRVYLDRSKTDQFGRGAFVSIAPAVNPKLCPVRAIKEWIAIAPGPGPLFRPVTRTGSVIYRRLSAVTVSTIVKGFGVVLDLPDDRLGAHSLRAGMVTALIESGAGELRTMEHSRHRSADTLNRYYRPRGSAINFTQMAGL